MFKAWFLSPAGASGKSPHLPEPQFPDPCSGCPRGARSTELSWGLNKMCEAVARHFTVTTHSVNTGYQHLYYCYCVCFFLSPGGA